MDSTFRSFRLPIPFNTPRGRPKIGQWVTGDRRPLPATVSREIGQRPKGRAALQIPEDVGVCDPVPLRIERGAVPSRRPVSPFSTLSPTARLHPREARQHSAFGGERGAHVAGATATSSRPLCLRDLKVFFPEIGLRIPDPFSAE